MVVVIDCEYNVTVYVTHHLILKKLEMYRINSYNNIHFAIIARCKVVTKESNSKLYNY